MDSTGPSLGIVFPAAAAVESLPAFARKVEAAGFAELWLVEDCFLSGGLTMAATALAVTERLVVGIGLLPAAVRNPAIAAMEVASLARLHPGRIRVAIGRGVPSWMAQIGAAPRRRMAALEEVVVAIRALLRGETVTLAGGGADGFLLPEGCGPTFTRWACLEATGARDDGSTPLDRVVYSWARIDDDVDAARAALESSLRHWLECGLYPEAYRRAGVEPAAPIDLGTLAAEVAVHGDEASCVAGLQRLGGAGATSVVLQPVGRDVDGQIERFAAGVLPLVGGATPTSERLP
jgi:alkanesulfonate monooxygenase SsuD/methylene tetrahydromethanopterin reductase-like flavin-dependent oxidoreductase (luciferase family)